MRPLRVLGVLGVLAVPATAVTAHAEPQAAGMSVKVEPSTAGCGQLFTGHIQLGSTDGKNAVGHLELTVQGHTTKVPFEVGASTQKFSVTSSRPLSCKDGLGTPTFNVYREGKIVQTVKLAPKAFRGELLTSVSAAPGKPWIRRVAVQGTCGAPGAVGTIDVFSSQGGPVQANVGVELAGAVTAVAPVTVQPNQASQVKVQVPNAINCEANGIPPVKYTFANATPPTPAAGSLEPTEIVFEL